MARVQTGTILLFRVTLKEHSEHPRRRHKPARDPPQARKRSPTNPNKPTRDPPQIPTSPQAWMMDDISTTLGGFPPQNGTYVIHHPCLRACWDLWGISCGLAGICGGSLAACGGSLAGLRGVPCKGSGGFWMGSKKRPRNLEIAPANPGGPPWKLL